MSRLLRTALTWMLALALPLQGVAAHTMRLCGPAHHAAPAAGLSHHAAPAAGLSHHAAPAAGLSHHAAAAAGLRHHAAAAAGLCHHAAAAAGLCHHAAAAATGAHEHHAAFLQAEAGTDDGEVETVEPAQLPHHDVTADEASATGDVAKAGDAKCSACASCCGAAVLVAADLVFEPIRFSADYAPAPLEAHLGRPRGGLDRPPRIALA